MEKEEVLRVRTRYFAKKFQENKEDGNEEERGNRGQNIYKNEEGQDYLIEVEEEERQISYDEVHEAVNRIRTKKASGHGIYPELVKYEGTRLKNSMWQLFSQIWKEERIPDEWEENIVPIHKKGDTLNCDNYRAICLSVVILKVLSDIIEKRLRELVEDHLEEEQAAYRKGRQTQDHIYVLRSITEKAIDTDSPIYLAL
jgi:hypothetical protein